MIEEQPNGRWKVTVYRRVPGAPRDRKRICRTVDTEAAAEALEAKLKGRPVDADGRTLVDVVGRYVDLHGPRLAPATENSYRDILAKRIAPSEVGTTELDRIGVDDLEWFYAGLLAGTAVVGLRPLSTNSVRNVHRLISAAINDHLRLPADRRWIDHNPAARARVNGPTPTPRALEDYDLADVALILDAAGELSESKYAGGANATRIINQARELADLAQMAIATGAREGELAGLRWRDVDLIGGAVAFNGSISRGRGTRAWIRKTTKTGKPRRVRVDAGAVAMLEARYARQWEQATDAGVDSLDNVAIFSLELEADFTSPAAMGNRWRRAATKAGVAITFHDLRHINASEMIAANVPVPNATKRNGWSSARMFFDVYGHRRADGDEHAISALAATWTAIAGHRRTDDPI